MRALSPGDLVARVAPASWSSEEWIEISTDVLESWGPGWVRTWATGSATWPGVTRTG